MRWNRSPAILAGLICVCLTALCCGGTMRHDVPPAIHAALATHPLFDSVVHVEGHTPSFGYYGSGTLITADIVLTAAHVVDDATSLDVTVGDTMYSADMWGAFPGWQPNNPFNLITGLDIGLIHLDTPVPDVTPATRYRGREEVGRPGIFAGYGTTGTGLTGELNYDGVKRVGINMIDTYFLGDADTSRLFLVDFDNPLNPSDGILGSQDPLSLEYLIASGDSGGPVFIGTESGLEVAGIHSFGFGLDFIADSDYGDITGHTRVTIFNDWIDSAIEAIGTLGAGGSEFAVENALPGFVVKNRVVPEPGTLALIGLGTVLAGFCRRKR